MIRSSEKGASNNNTQKALCPDLPFLHPVFPQAPRELWSCNSQPHAHLLDQGHPPVLNHRWHSLTLIWIFTCHSCLQYSFLLAYALLAAWFPSQWFQADLHWFKSTLIRKNIWRQAIPCTKTRGMWKQKEMLLGATAHLLNKPAVLKICSPSCSGNSKPQPVGWIQCLGIPLTKGPYHSAGEALFRVHDLSQTWCWPAASAIVTPQADSAPGRFPGRCSWSATCFGVIVRPEESPWQNRQPFHCSSSLWFGDCCSSSRGCPKPV